MHPSPRRALLPLAVLTVLGPGCAFFASFDKSGKQAATDRYDGDECSAFEVREDVEYVNGTGTENRVVRHLSPQPARVDALPLRVAKVACGDSIDMYPPDGGASAYVQYHHDFDARRFDHATAALILTMCHKDSRCIGAPGPNSVRDDDYTHYAAGQLAFYAERVDPKAVDRDLKAAGVSEPLRQHFVADLAKARAEVKRIVAEIPAVAAEVLVDIPLAVRKERAAEDARHAELYARFDALATTAHAQREKGGDEATIVALEDLRAQWVKACGDPTCFDRGLGVHIARELFFAHVARQDGLGAQVERSMADPQTPIEAAVEIDRRQAEAMGAASETHRKQAALRDQGLDEGTTRAATAGVVAYDFSRVRRWDLEKVRTVQWAQLVPGDAEPRSWGGTLRAKKSKGATTVLEFADKVDRYADEVCHETRRVERIESDGRLIYEQKCRATGKTNVHRTKIDPVVVPTREAKPLEIGDDVNVLVVGGEPMPGRVVSALRKEKIVQRRDVRIGK